MTVSLLGFREAKTLAPQGAIPFKTPFVRASSRGVSKPHELGALILQDSRGSRGT